MSELPCPFCGGEAEIQDWSPLGGDKVFIATCKKCHDVNMVADSEASAIAAWNTRAVPPCPPVVWGEDEMNFTHPLKRDETILPMEDGTFYIIWSQDVTEHPTLKEAQETLIKCYEEQWKNIHGEVK